MLKVLQASIPEYYFATMSHGYKGYFCMTFLWIWNHYKKLFHITLNITNFEEVTITKLFANIIQGPWLKVAKGYIPFVTVKHRYKVLILHGNRWLFKICTFSWNSGELPFYSSEAFDISSRKWSLISTLQKLYKLTFDTVVIKRFQNLGVLFISYPVTSSRYICPWENLLAT